MRLRQVESAGTVPGQPCAPRGEGGAKRRMRGCAGLVSTRSTFALRGATPPDRRQPAMAPRRYARSDIRPRGAMTGAPLRFAPSGDCDRSAWLVGDQDVLLPKPAVRPFRAAKRLGCKRPSRRARVKAREAKRSDRRSRLGLEARSPRWRRGVWDLRARF